MKLLSRRLALSRKSQKLGFTLVELLVVIGIIAILAGVLFPAANSAIKAAKRARANATINQIQTAALAYYTEYSVYPVPTVTGTATDYEIHDGTNTSDGANWGDLIYALCGNSNPASTFTPSGTGTITNTRSIAFLTMKTSDVYTTAGFTGLGAPQNPLAVSTTTWGATSSYNIAIDGDYDGNLGSGNSSVTDMPNFNTSVSGSMTLTGGTSTAGVAIWGNCNQTTTASSLNPAFYVHTY